MAPKRYFNLYLDYRQHLELLSDEERGRLLLALFDYAETGEPPALDGMSKMAFSFMKSQLDRDFERYQAKCEKNRGLARKRWDSNKCETVPGDANECGRMPEDANACERIPEDANNKTKNNTKNNTKTKTNTKKNTREGELSRPHAQEKKAYGEFENVLLTGEEHGKLVDSLGETAALDYIERLSAYLAQTGKRYKSHYATILCWWRKDGVPDEPPLLPPNHPESMEELAASDQNRIHWDENTDLLEALGVGF